MIGAMRSVLIIALAAFVTIWLGACEHRDKLADADDTSCRSYGLKPATKPYNQCRSVLAHQRGVAFKGFDQGGFDQTITAGCNISTHICSPDGVRSIPAP
jgi:hypothetical protein